MRVQWFGESWGAPICDPQDHAPNPGGQCMRCDAAITSTDQGVLIPHYGFDVRDAFHLRCFLEAVGIAREGGP